MDFAKPTNNITPRMKIPLGILTLAVLTPSGLLFAQEAGNPAPIEETQSATAEKPLPRLHFTADDVLESKTTDLGDRRITMQKVVPVELPPIPEPAPPPDPSDPVILAKLAELRGKY